LGRAARALRRPLKCSVYFRSLVVVGTGLGAGTGDRGNSRGAEFVIFCSLRCGVSGCRVLSTESKNTRFPRCGVSGRRVLSTESENTRFPGGDILGCRVLSTALEHTQSLAA